MPWCSCDATVINFNRPTLSTHQQTSPDADSRISRPFSCSVKCCQREGTETDGDSGKHHRYATHHTQRCCETTRHNAWVWIIKKNPLTWWRPHMETLYALLAICAGNSPVTGEFPSQRSVTRSFDVFFDLHLNKRLSKQSWGWWFETPSRPSWRHRNVKFMSVNKDFQTCATNSSEARFEDPF